MIVVIDRDQYRVVDAGIVQWKIRSRQAADGGSIPSARATNAELRHAFACDVRYGTAVAVVCAVGGYGLDLSLLMPSTAAQVARVSACRMLDDVLRVDLGQNAR